MSLTAEQRLIALRIVTRMRDIPRHEATLDLAIAAFGERFDEARFVEAAVSKDPAQLLLVYGVQSGFENLQNHLAGLARAALELVGELSTAEPPNTARDLRRLERLGVITRARCDTVISFQRLRNGLQHEYAETAPEELHAAVVLLRGEFRGFLSDYQRWLKSVIDALDQP